MRKNKATCDKCGHKISTKNDKSTIIYPDIFDNVSEQKSLPIYAPLYHQGFWTTDNHGMHVASLDEHCNRNSVMLRPDCLFYVYKIAFRHLLLSMDVIEPSDIDAANLVPHVVVRKNSTDSFSKYTTIGSHPFLITRKDLSSKQDFLMIELDKKRDLHMTLIFSKGIGKRVNLVEAFINLIKLLNYMPDLIDSYASLSYFGQKEIHYWYETRASYPHNIIMPNNYQVPTKEVVTYQVSNAGSIL